MKILEFTRRLDALEKRMVVVEKKQKPITSIERTKTNKKYKPKK